ncbi:GTPase IMAP family member 7-like [Enoplosus armatus]|uniref:GTPase IMAP family member 7-like n=1 Tax=Enoplosus armatus TaxID=215367 RepID=UPI003994E673
MDVSIRRIVVVGKTGAGKSSLANTIFREKLFKMDHSFSSGTSECKAETKSVNGRSLTLIDTPGFFDTDRSEEDLKPEIVRCITECAPGPHAFLIVLKVEKFTEHEQAVIKEINQCFSEEAFKYAAVLFTHGDQLPEGQKIKDFVHQNKFMNELMTKCGSRCHVIDNKYWNEKPKDEYRSNPFQVEELLNTIDKMVMENKGSCYTNETLQVVEEEIKQEEELIRQSSGNMSEEEIREQAKDRVATKLSVRLAGIGTGVLLGALCGDFIFGAVAGGVKGYHAAEGAVTAQEAVEKTVKAIKDGVLSFWDRLFRTDPRSQK